MGRMLLGVGGLAIGLAAGGLLLGAGRAHSAEGAAREQAEAQRVLAESQEVLEALDDLEARLFAGRATVRTWSELAARHQQVSALACHNAEVHAEGVARHVRRQQRNAASARKVAAARAGVASDAQVTGYKAPAAATSSGKLAP